LPLFYLTNGIVRKVRAKAERGEKIWRIKARSEVPRGTRRSKKKEIGNSSATEGGMKESLGVDVRVAFADKGKDKTR